MKQSSLNIIEGSFKLTKENTPIKRNFESDNLFNLHPNNPSSVSENLNSLMMSRIND